MNELILTLAVWQVAAPIALIGVHAVVPAASHAGLALRTLAILLLLLYDALVGVWLFPPWWTPYALAALHMLVSVRLWRRLRQRPPPSMRPRLFELGAASALVVAALWLIAPAIAGRTVDGVAIDLATPLGPGRYLIVSGGASVAINAHLLTLDKRSAVAFRGQSYGVDIIAIDASGLRASGVSPPDPADYAIYGRVVRAPCAGRVRAVVDGVPDNIVPVMNRAAMSGNSVILECDGLAVVLAHFIPGSTTVCAGDFVTAGQPVALVGNSGNSGEPHLHVHVQTIAPHHAPLSGEPLWFTINGALPTRNARLFVLE